MSKLKPCPFCGGHAEALTTAGTEFGTYWHFAECMMCDTKSGLYESEAILKEAWNRRADDANRDDQDRRGSIRSSV